ncbi:MAG: phosphatidylglycerol lysyltransferase [Alkalispirochaeta sp.]
MNQDRIELLRSMVLSASGWRGVFGGDDASMNPSISPAFRDIVAVAADTFADSVERRIPDSRKPVTIVIGTDSRPTGPAIADTAVRVFLKRGYRIRWLGVVTTPELMSYTKMDDDCDAFFYISASHNPPGHNGLKMGYADGAVMPASEAGPLIEAFTRRVESDDAVDALLRGITAVSPGSIDAVFAEHGHHKAESRERYRRFALTVARGPAAGDRMDIDRFSKRLRLAMARAPLGIVAELNGSARSTSIDRSLLTELGVRVAVHNDTPGTFSHQILPEGAGLSDAVTLLERYHAVDPAFQVGYVPDNDGDRGNLVFIDNDGTAVPLDAQTVFALVVAIELSWLRYREVPGDRLAVVANGPTSIRIDRICERFGASLFRAEVGEANVVHLAEELDRDGYLVAILGEGSNGGNITPPATVRDPLSTLLGLVKYHSFRLDTCYRDDVDATEPLGDPLPFIAFARGLPRFRTLPTDDPRAKMQVGAVPQGTLKRRYEELVPLRVPEVLQLLEKGYPGPLTWRLVNYEGTRSFPGPGGRSGAERGGLRVVFSDRDGVDRAAVWMRGSGTEPVFRVLADCEGDDEELLDRLIMWQRDLVSTAATGAAG